MHGEMMLVLPDSSINARDNVFSKDSSKICYLLCHADSASQLVREIVPMLNDIIG